MPEFKIEGDAIRRESRVRLLSWGAVVTFGAVTVWLVILRSRGLSANSDLRWVALFSFLGAFFGLVVVAAREGLSYAKRQMVFVLDDNEIVRERRGYPPVKIRFCEIEYLGEELNWLIIRSVEPRKKIAIPKNVKGYELICTELAKHHPLSVRTKVRLPLTGVSLIVVSIVSWAAVLCAHDPRVVIVGGIVGLTFFGFASYKLWVLLGHGRTRFLALVYLGFAWTALFLLIYVRALRL